MPTLDKLFTTRKRRSIARRLLIAARFTIDIRLHGYICHALCDEILRRIAPYASLEGWLRAHCSTFDVTDRQHCYLVRHHRLRWIESMLTELDVED